MRKSRIHPVYRLTVAHRRESLHCWEGWGRLRKLRRLEVGGGTEEAMGGWRKLGRLWEAVGSYGRL